jgi:hypothetical protein
MVNSFRQELIAELSMRKARGMPNWKFILIGAEVVSWVSYALSTKSCNTSSGTCTHGDLQGREQRLGDFDRRFGVWTTLNKEAIPASGRGIRHLLSIRLSIAGCG